MLWSPRWFEWYGSNHLWREVARRSMSEIRGDEREDFRDWWRTLTIRSISFLLIIPSLSWSYVRKTYFNFSRRLPVDVKAKPMRNSRKSEEDTTCFLLNRSTSSNTHQQFHRYWRRTPYEYQLLVFRFVPLCRYLYCVENWPYLLWRSFHWDRQPGKGQREEKSSRSFEAIGKDSDWPWVYRTKLSHFRCRFSPYSK